MPAGDKLNYSVKHNNTEIFFSIERRDRRTTTIQVHRDQSVKVLAPRFSTKRSIEKMVIDRGDWILKKQKQFAGFPFEQKNHSFISGEKLCYLGKEFTLLMKTGKASVEASDGRIILSIPEGSTVEQRRKLLREWYRKQSEKVFAERIPLCVKAAGAIGITNIPEWKSRVLKRSWGSCSGKGKINLNLELVSAPQACIDYVILHEICHLKEHNHSRRFYSLLNKICPDWKARRKELNEGYFTKLL